MDAKQLYRSYQSKYDSSNWLNAEGQVAQREGDVNWIYCGLNNDFKSEIVKQSIINFFAENEVYLCISSTKSLLVEKSKVDTEIKEILHKKELGIIDKDFTKIMFFSSIGVFKLGIIRDFPKKRDKPLGECLKVKFFACKVNCKTTHVPSIIDGHFAPLEKALNKDYGGWMEHLWIELELVEGDKPWPFRFQKRVESLVSYTEFYAYNVGHYSIQPNYEKLSALSSEDEICSYLFGILYQSTKILENQQKKLGGFDALAFRADFFNACKEMGYLFADADNL